MVYMSRFNFKFNVISIFLVLVTVIFTTALVVNSDSKVKQTRANGDAVLEHIKVSGTGNALYDLGRVKPGVWRLSIALGVDSRLGKVTLVDVNGVACAQTPPPVVMAFVSQASGGVCHGGSMSLKIDNATAIKSVIYYCSKRDNICKGQEIVNNSNQFTHNLYCDNEHYSNKTCQQFRIDDVQQRSYSTTYEDTTNWFVLMERVATAKI